MKTTKLQLLKKLLYRKLTISFTSLCKTNENMTKEHNKI